MNAVDSAHTVFIGFHIHGSTSWTDIYVGVELPLALNDPLICKLAVVSGVVMRDNCSSCVSC